MMDQHQIDFFRKQLEDQRDQVMAEMDNHRLPTDPVSDLEEKADRTTSNLVEARITEDDENLLGKIELALQRLDAGTYQKCQHCGEAIPLERLEAPSHPHHSA